MGSRRKRSRSRSRDRSRRYKSRSRSPSRGRRQSDRSRFLIQDEGVAAQVQQQQMAALQQQQLHQQLLAQQLATLPQAAGTGAAGSESAAQLLDKKQREVYVGNLAVGSINSDLLGEFFNQSLAHLVPNPIATPPVVNINMDGAGRFAFVELRSRECADFALSMDKIVEVCGRMIHVGRPRGWVEPTGPPLPVALAGEPSQAPTGPPPTRVLLLANILPIAQLREQEDRDILQEEVLEEAKKHAAEGTIEAVVVPCPPKDGQDRGAGRCYILYTTTEEAVKAKDIFDGRTLDDNKIKVRFVEEDEFQSAKNGEWVSRQHSVAGVPLPGLYEITPLVGGITGLSALNPALAALVQTNQSIAEMMKANVIEEEVPFEEGYVKLRGIPMTATKQQIAEFFKECGDVVEEDVKLILSPDGTSLGESFIHFKGPNAKMRLALTKDRSPFPQPGSTHLAEVLTSIEGDIERRMLSGCKVV